MFIPICALIVWGVGMVLLFSALYWQRKFWTEEIAEFEENWLKKNQNIHALYQDAYLAYCESNASVVKMARIFIDIKQMRIKLEAMQDGYASPKDCAEWIGEFLLRTDEVKSTLDPTIREFIELES